MILFSRFCRIIWRVLILILLWRFGTICAESVHTWAFVGWKTLISLQVMDLFKFLICSWFNFNRSHKARIPFISFMYSNLVHELSLFETRCDFWTVPNIKYTEYITKTLLSYQYNKLGKIFILKSSVYITSTLISLATLPIPPSDSF